MFEKEIQMIIDTLKEELKDIDVANLTKEEAEKIYRIINSKVSDLLKDDYFMPEPGPLNYGELFVDRIMSSVGLKYTIEDFLPRFQRNDEEERYVYQSLDDLPPMK